jgi:hypothetical protein
LHVCAELGDELLKDIVRALNGYLMPEERAEIYDEVCLSLTYHESGLIEVEARPSSTQLGVGGGTRRLSTWTPRCP